jgi:uncharacterized protein
MTDLLYSAAPVFEIDGRVRGELARDLRHLKVEETTAGMKTLTARYLGIGPVAGSDRDADLYLDGAILDFGKRLNVSIGPADGARTIFSGTISGLEACRQEGREPEVAVFAEDRLMTLRMTRRMRTYENVSDADIASAIAAEHGLSAAVDADGPTYDVVQQWNQSDLAFLRERGSLIQAELWLADDTLYFQTRDKRTATTLTLVQGNQLVSMTARADLAHQRSEVRVSGYDASERDAIDESAGPEAVQAEVSGGRTGPDILQRAFGDCVSYRVRQNPQKSAEATAWARAEMLRRARSFVTLTGTTNGSPDMVVGSRLSLERAGAPFDGSGYYVTQVCHTYDLSSGHRTHFQAERATVQEAS